jgi:hypothetical protein
MVVNTNKNIDFSRINLPSKRDADVKLAPPNFGQWNKNQPQQKQPPSNPWGQLKNNFNDSEPYRNGNGSNRNNGGRNNRNNYGRQNSNQMSPPPQNASKATTSFNSHRRETSRLIEKDFLKSNVKAAFNGNLTTEQMINKMKGYKLDVQVIYDICCDYYEQKESNRRHLIEILDVLCQREFMTKYEIVKSFEEIVATVEEFICDSPRAYQYIGEYFGEYF